jgi:hypothetical protein
VNYTTGVADDLPLGAVNYQTVSFTNFLDTGAGNDFGMSAN